MAIKPLVNRPIRFGLGKKKWQHAHLLLTYGADVTSPGLFNWPLVLKMSVSLINLSSLETILGNNGSPCRRGMQ
jgi:hypothetical protein